MATRRFKITYVACLTLLLDSADLDLCTCVFFFFLGRGWVFYSSGIHDELIAKVLLGIPESTLDILFIKNRKNSEG